MAWEVLSRADEGVGRLAGNRVELYDLGGNLVARGPRLSGQYFFGDAGRPFYWGTSELTGPWLSREQTINLLPDQECQFPADPFYPYGPYLSACAGEGEADRPRQIVVIDPVTMTPTEVLATNEQWPYDSGWAPWTRSGPNGEVVVQLSLECEVPRAYYLEDGAYVPVWPEGEVSTVHLGWTASGGSLLQVLGGGCGTGGPPGIYLQQGETWDLVVPGEGASFRWIEFADPNYNANVRELRLLRALQNLGVKQCCGEPHHGSSSVSSGMTWNGVDLFVGGADLTRADRSATVLGRYDVEQVPVTVSAHEPGEHHSFACGDTIYGVSSYFDQVAPDRAAVEALIGALGCNP